MKAMILAAGLGTRLSPLTRYHPKALMPLGNRPLIDRNIAYLQSHGVTEMVVNAHHLSYQILTHLGNGECFGIPIQVRVERKILGTGGGIKNAADFWDDDPFIVLNGDILTDINLGEAYEGHLKSGALATLILHQREPFNQVLVDNRMNLVDITTKNLPGRLAFTGIHIINPALLSLIPGGRFSSIVDHYKTLIASGRAIRGHFVEGHQWHDIGTIPAYIEANRTLSCAEPFLLGDECDIHSGSEMKDWAVVGASCSIRENALVERSVLWEHITVYGGARVIDSVVTSGREVRQDLVDAIY
ncbi:MAG: NDP-sugar synthase [Desulfatiglandaceae bacterium]